MAYQQPYQPYQQQPGYPPPPPMYPMAPRTSSMAIVSLIAGIASWVVLPLIGAIVAIITGNMAKKEINSSMGQITGAGMATAGQVLGWVNLALSVCGVCLTVLYFAGALGSIGLSNLNY